ncbi:MAG: neutral/alkaline non-lysosomal ceramidase N-terminal domain-containing protein [Armatimonadota bacterium]
MSGLRAGTAVIDVTPPLGTFMGGYAAREHGAEGVHDPLHAKALALAAGDASLLLITCDVISFNYEYIDPVRARIEAATGIPAANVLVSNSHTHSGPLTHGVLGDDLIDEQYLDVLAAKLVSVAEIAASKLRPATVGFARAEASVGYNRREMLQEEPLEGAPLRGPLAPWVDVMAVRDEAGAFLAAWFCHAAHAVVLGGDNYLISADWPGAAQAAIEAVHPGCAAMFAQGCCGDINAIRSRPGTFEEVRSRGYEIAGAVIGAMERAEPITGISLASVSRTIEMPLQDPPPADEVAAEIAALREQRADAEAAGDAVFEQVFRWRIRRREQFLELAPVEAHVLTRPLKATALRIGPAVIVGLPGEVLVEYALWIERDSPFERTIVPAYTNGMVGYVATASAIVRGGYEVHGSFDYYGGLPLRPEVEPIVLQGVAEMLEELR